MKIALAVLLFVLGVAAAAACYTTIDFATQSDALMLASVRAATHLGNAEAALWRLRYTDDPALVATVQGNLRAYEAHMTQPEERAALHEWHAVWAKHASHRDARYAAGTTAMAQLRTVQRASAARTFAEVTQARASMDRVVAVAVVAMFALGMTLLVALVRLPLPARLRPSPVVTR
jgi:hypothetical protein